MAVLRIVLKYAVFASLGLLVLGFLRGISREGGLTGGAGSSGARETVRVDHAGISDAEAEAWAREVERQLAEGVVDFIGRDLDIETFARVALARHKLDRRTRAQVVRDVISKRKDYVKELGNGLLANEGLTSQFLRIRRDSDGVRAVFRLVGDGGLDYIAFDLQKKAGSVQFYDLERLGAFASIADRIGDFIVSSMQLAAGASDESQLRKVEARIYEIASAIRDIEMNDELTIEEVLVLHNSLPEFIKATRFLMLRLASRHVLVGDTESAEKLIKRAVLMYGESESTLYARLQLAEQLKDFAAAAHVAALNEIFQDPALELLGVFHNWRAGTPGVSLDQMDAFVQKDPRLADLRDRFLREAALLGRSVEPEETSAATQPT